jgi:hypothetical protein
MMKNTCPKCNCNNVTFDGDFVEELDTAGQLVDGHYYSWWLCKDCGHQWRYQDERLNPGGTTEKD